MAADPYELIADDSKTTITASGGIALGYGPGPGLANASFWNRIGSLFSCYRPSVGLLNVFSSKDLHQPLHLKKRKALWHPNHVAANYTAPGLAVGEDRYASKSGLHSRLRMTNTRKLPQNIVLCFHGAVEQQPFFDYPRTETPPNITCEINPKRREVTITQPHPHHGLPQVVNAVQRVWLELPGANKQALASCGFGQSEDDLRTLWHDHSVLSSLRMRLGQVGGRYAGGFSGGAGGSACDSGSGRTPNRPEDGLVQGPAPTQKIEFAHPHPLYYLTVALELAPGETREVILRTDFHTDDEAGDLRTASEQKRRYPKPDVALKREAAAWRKYLSTEVPQLDCDDSALVRYWYYVWYVLRSNRTAGGRHIKQAFTAPSKYMYWGPWIWDGYFHVLGEMWLQDKSIAEDTIRSVLDMQFPNGYIPVCSGANYRMCFHEDVPGYKNPQGGGYASYVESELAGYKELKHPFEAEITAGAKTFIHNEKTQTPLITCALEELSFVRLDHKVFSEFRDQFIAYDNWLARRRTDKKGRFILWHGDESGWDNSTRHYPVPAKPFDVQVHLALHHGAMIHFAEPDYSMDDTYPFYDLSVYKNALKSLKTYWDSNDQWHYDFGATGDGQRTGKRRKQIAASGLFSMLTYDRHRSADACVNALNHPKVFNTPYPIPTLAKCDPDYTPHGWGWNGPAWLQVNYFTITGLLDSDKFTEAFELWEKTKRLIIREGKPYSYELYDPEHGTGIGCPDYSWQAMINHLIIRYFAGVHYSCIRPHLPDSMQRIKLSNLPGLVESIEIKRQGKIVKLNITLPEFSKKAIQNRTKYCLPPIDTKALGKVDKVIGNSYAFFITPNGMWSVSDETRSQKTWEIIITCR